MNDPNQTDKTINIEFPNSTEWFPFNALFSLIFINYNHIEFECKIKNLFLEKQELIMDPIIQ